MLRRETQSTPTAERPQNWVVRVLDKGGDEISVSMAPDLPGAEALQARLRAAICPEDRPNRRVVIQPRTDVAMAEIDIRNRRALAARTH